MHCSGRHENSGEALHITDGGSDCVGVHGQHESAMPAPDVYTAGPPDLRSCYLVNVKSHSAGARGAEYGVCCVLPRDLPAGALDSLSLYRASQTVINRVSRIILQERLPGSQTVRQML